jgi:hypothetical protein
MYRGTTPTLTFTLPFEASKLDYLSIAFAQKATPYAKDATLILEKELRHCTLNGNAVVLELTENDTLAMDCHFDVEIQLRAKCAGKSMASKIYTVPVKRILKDGCLP